MIANLPNGEKIRIRGETKGFLGQAEPGDRAYVRYNATAERAEFSPVSDYVESIAALEALNTTPLRDGEIVQVLGYYTVNDGGGGLFYYDSSSTATANGGTIIEPDSGVGRWVRIYSGNVHAEWFGAKGDAVTDDFAALEAAVTWLADNDGGTLEFSPATYRLATSSSLSIGLGVNLLGHSTTLLRDHFLTGNTGTGAITGERFMALAVGNNQIQGITWDGNNTGTTVAVFGVSNSPSYPWMNTSGVINQTQYGDLGIGNFFASGEASIRISHCRFVNSCGSAIKNQEDGAKNVSVTNCYFTGYYDHAFYFAGWPDFDGDDIKITGLQFSDNNIQYADQSRGNGALKLRNNVEGVVYANNVLNIPNDTAFAFDVGDSTYGSAAVKKVVVTGNQIICRDLLNSTNSYPADVLDAHEVAFKGNTVTFSTAAAAFLARQPGYDLYPSGSIDFSNNVFYNPSASAYVFVQVSGSVASGAATHWTFSGNRFIGFFTLDVYGSSDLSVNENTVINVLNPDTVNPVFFASATATNYRPTGAAKWVFRSNTLINYGTLLSDLSDTTSGATGKCVLESATVSLFDNVVVSHPSRNWLTDIRGATVAAYVGSNRVQINGGYAAGGSFSTSSTLPSTLVTYPTATFDTLVTITGAAGTNRRISLETAGSRRWVLAASSTAETGSDAGSPFQINAHDDSGTYIDTPLLINRIAGGGMLITRPLSVLKTITAAGTTGARTINQTSGSVNFAAAATSLVVTNSLVSTTSIILCTVAANDTTMKSVAVVAGAGSFTIYPNAAPTAETRVNFLVLN